MARPMWPAAASWRLFLLAVAVLAPAASPLAGQTVVGTISQPGLDPRAVAVYEAGDKVYVGGDPTGTIYVYDATTLAPLGTVTIPGAVLVLVVHQQSARLFAAWSLAGVGNRHISVVDATTDTYLGDLGGTYSNVFPGLLQVDEDLGKLYALTLEGLTQIDVGTLGETPIPGFGGGGFEEIALNPVTHEVFVTQFIPDELEIIDGLTLDTTTVADLGGLGITVNSNDDKVYILFCESGSICIYDRAAGTFTTLGPNANDATEATYNPVSNRVYTDSEVDGIATHLEGASDVFFHLPMPQATVSPVVREATDHVYYVNKDFIAAVDGATQLVELIPVDNPVAGFLPRLAIHQGSGRVFAIVNDNLDEVLVIQDHPAMTRPPIYVGTLAFPAEIYVIDPPSRTVVDVWDAPSAQAGPQALAVRPGGGRIYVPNPWLFDNELQIFAGAGSRSDLDAIATGGDGPFAVAVSPDRGRIYVSNNRSDDVAVIDAITVTLLTNVPVGDGPLGLAATPDGTAVLVANENAGTVSVIDAASLAVTSTIAVGTAPRAVALNPAGTRAWITNQGSASVSVIDVATRAVVATVAVGATPRWAAVTPDGRRVYVTNRGSGTVSVIDAGSDSVIDTVPVGASPEGIAALPDGTEIFVVNSNPAGPSSVSVIATSSHAVETFDLPPNNFTDVIKATGLTVADPSSRIAGRVSAAGVPVAGALIRWLQSGEEVTSSLSNEAGDYSGFDLLPGTYDVEITAAGFFPHSTPGVSVATGETVLVHAALVSADPIFADGFESGDTSAWSRIRSRLLNLPGRGGTQPCQQHGKPSSSRNAFQRGSP